VKISKSTLIFLIIGIFLIAAISLGMVISQQDSQRTSLGKNLQSAKVRLAQIKLDDLVDQKDQLSTQISQYQSQTAEVKTRLAESRNSIDITGTILLDARNCAILIKELNSSGLDNDNLEKVRCQTSGMNIKAVGSVENLAGFVIVLSRRFPTSVIKTTLLERLDTRVIEATPPPAPSPTPSPGPSPEASPVATPAPAVTPIPTPGVDFAAEINLVIYNLKGE
jgi:hypothetical protein